MSYHYLLTRCAGRHIRLVRPIGEDQGQPVYNGDAGWCFRCEDPLVRHQDGPTAEPKITIRQGQMRATVKGRVLVGERFVYASNVIWDTEPQPGTPVREMLRAFAVFFLGPASGTDVAQIESDQELD